MTHQTEHERNVARITNQKKRIDWLEDEMLKYKGRYLQGWGFAVLTIVAAVFWGLSR